MRGREKHLNNWRGDVMRRMAAIHAEMQGLRRGEMSAEKYDARTKEFKKQLAELQAKMLT